jgi:anti-sigma B factor antagonist
MTISKKLDGDKLIIALDGRLDTLSAPDLEKDARESLNGVKELVFDFENLEYISSAGLRVLLAIQKMLGDAGAMKVTNANDIVKEVFEVTGFSDMITVE